MRKFWLERGASGSDALPRRCDVLVVGGGLAGVACARALAVGGASVALCEASNRLGGGSIGRDPGLVQVGTSEHPHRLRAAIGDEDAAAYLALSRRSASLLRDRVAVEEGLVRVGLGAEGDEIDESVAASNALGLRSLRVDTELGPARRVEGDGLVDPVEVVETLAAEARAAGAALVTHAEVRHIAPGFEARIGAMELRCEMVVFCAGAATRELDSWFGDKLWPVRLETLALSGTTWPISTQHGYLTWRPAPWGMLAGGARWATPHMEVGETSLEGSARVRERLEDMTRKHLPDCGDVLGSQARIECFTCDNLPLVGPLPGRPRKLVCTGFGEHALSLAIGAAEALAEGILTGTSTIPARLNPGRLV